MSIFRVAKTVHVESLEPGLQHFTTEAEHTAAIQQLADHEASQARHISPLSAFVATVSAIPVVGAIVGDATKLVLGPGEAKQEAEHAADVEALFGRIAANDQAAALSPEATMNGNGGLDLSSIISNLGTGLINAVVARRSSSSAAPAVLPGGAIAPIPTFAMAAAPAAGGVMTTIGNAARTMLGIGGTAVAAAAGVIRSVGGKILGVMLPSGQRVTRTAAVNLAKSLGLQTAAAAMAISAAELAEMVLAEEQSKSKRRGKSITPSALRTTRRTMRTVGRMHQQIVRAAAKAKRC